MYQIHLETMIEFSNRKMTIQKMIEEGINEKLIKIVGENILIDNKIINSFLDILEDFDKSENEREELLKFIQSLIGVYEAEQHFNKKMKQYNDILDQLHERQKTLK